MNDRLIKLVEEIREDEPLEPKHWIEIFHNWNEYYKTGVEWGAAYITGESRDLIFERHNFFGSTPEEALIKLEKFLNL